MSHLRTLTLLLLAASCAATERVPPEIRAPQLAREVLILDGHVDVPIRLYGQKRSGGEVDDVSMRTQGGDFDWERAVAGGLDAPFMSIYTPASSEGAGTSKAMADELIDLVEGIAAASPEKFGIARTAEQVRRAFSEGKIALLMGMENGSPIEGDLANLDHFFERGVRYITLCHSKDNHICDSSYDDRHTHGGLTPFGREVVERMNRLGIMVDVSHISDDSFWQVMEITRAPAIASHSSLRHFVPGFERNMSDEMVRRLAENGGVIQINFGSSFLTAEANAYSQRRSEAQERFREEHSVQARTAEDRAFRDQWTAGNPYPFATVAVVADHIDRVVELVGVDHVGLGSDFDGVGPTLPIGLEDVSEYPNLLAELLRRGYSEMDIAKICSGNVLRVMEQVERIAAASR